MPPRLATARSAIRRRSTAIAVGVLLLTGLATAAVLCQQKGTSAIGNSTEWAALLRTKPTLRGCLRTADCSNYPTSPCRDYLVQALEYHWKDMHGTELRVTNLDHHKVIFADREFYSFLYMFPLKPSGNLLATVWGSADSQGGLKVYLLNGDDVKVVFDNGSRFSPQFITASESTANPIVLLDRYSGGIGAVVPTETEIWQWFPKADKFILCATVPIAQRFEAVARILGGNDH